MNSKKQQNCITTPNIIIDYLNQKKEIEKFYNLFPSYKNLIIQAKLKLNHFTNRSILIKIINDQFEENLNLEKLHPQQKKNLHLLSKENTVTITCGHQLNLITGPLYFIYKILQTIKLSNELNKIQNTINFIPIFWFATEDHDFLEINHFYFKGKKWTWEGKNDIDVGNKLLSNLLPLLSDFIKNIISLPHAEKIISLIQNSYFSSKNLFQATYKLINLIFSSYGLIGINPNAPELKKFLTPIIKEEFLNSQCFQQVSKTNEKLKQLNYKPQINPRKINLFELSKEKRIRIDSPLENYLIEKISPNVLIRPIYQEIILPNVAYIGGNIEISYWLQLKSYFDYFNIPFPILIPRNSLVLITAKQKEKLDRLNISYWDLLNQKHKSIEKIILKNQSIFIDFQKYTNQIHQIYESMIQESEKIEKTLKNLLLAQQQKQINQFEKLKKRILKAEKQRQKQQVNSIENIYKQLFPNDNLQERYINFLEFYFEYPNLLDLVYQEITTIIPYFKILII